MWIVIGLIFLTPLGWIGMIAFGYMVALMSIGAISIIEALRK
jgi:hypothetical protein